MTVDRFYSTDSVADELLMSIPSADASSFFDPAAGEGALLSAARRRFPRARLLGADSDRVTLKRLSASEPDWFLGVANVLNPRSLSASPVWAEASREAALWVLLNPPFSFRGGSGVRIVTDGEERTVSPAAAFVWHVMQRLPGTAGLAAIVPEGALYNTRDRIVWEHLETEHKISVRSTLGARSFRGVVVNTAIVTVERHEGLKPTPLSASNLPGPASACVCVEVIRGRVPNKPVACQDADGVRFLHSTDLNSGVTTDRMAPAHLATVGHLVLMPRVGPRSSEHVSEVSGPVVLSDCVLGVRAIAVDSRLALAQWVKTSAPQIDALYYGTGARHLTVARLIDTMRTAGWNVRHVRASSQLGVCECGSAEEVGSPRRLAIA
jgi:hypothetical protein